MRSLVTLGFWSRKILSWSTTASLPPPALNVALPVSNSICPGICTLSPLTTTGAGAGAGGGGGGGGGGAGVVGAAAGSDPAWKEAWQPVSAGTTTALARAITNADLPNMFEIPPLTLVIGRKPSAG